MSMLLAVFVTLLFLYSLAAKRLEGSIVTGPVFFTLAGLATALLLPAGLGLRAEPTAFLGLAEIGLVLLLFADASHSDLAVLRSIRALPTRLLTAGMLLSILLGALAARLVFPQLSLWEAGILSAILAPTDAGLGQVIVTSPRVPVRIRQALNVEAGLNDGLAVPFLLFFIALATTGGETGERLGRFALEQLGFGAAIGAAIGFAGGAAIALARRRGSISKSSESLAVVALPVLCLLACEGAGASAFIAAFVAGLAFQVGFREAESHGVEFVEEWGQLVNFAVFFLFGMMVAQGWRAVGAGALLYALLSLTVVRLLPVALALAGSRLSAATVVFMGWFGPRGLASIVLGLVFLEHEAHLPGEPAIRAAVMTTVAASVLLHGLSAAPGIGLYARRVAALDPAAPEHRATGA
jgi:NhaP-type Na+/H+ or K+/H+ antiporter